MPHMLTTTPLMMSCVTQTNSMKFIANFEFVFFFQVVDLDTGNNLGPGQMGEICFKCNYMMNGYFRNPKATADMIKNGWLYTGDIGYYDEKGYFFVVDRLKELIKYKGYQVIKICQGS